MSKDISAAPIAWMHDADGRVDVIHDEVKKLWIKVGQPNGFYREKVPCKVEHYTIPLYDHRTPGNSAAREALEFMLAYENDDESALGEIQVAFGQQNVVKDAQEFARCYCARKMRAALDSRPRSEDAHAADAAAIQPAGEVTRECGACNGSGWVPRDEDIGTEQECFSCDGSGRVEDDAPISVAAERGVDYIMAAVQEFASEWSLVGGRFDRGEMLEQAEATKARIRRMLEDEAAAPERAKSADDVPVAWAVFAPDGNCRIWFGNIEAARRWKAGFEPTLSSELTPLYTRPAPQAGSSSAAPSDGVVPVSALVAFSEKWLVGDRFAADALANVIDMQSLAAPKQTAAQGVPELSADQVEWVVNDNAELGVKIGNQFFFLYKGGSLVYESGLHDDDTSMQWRHVFKREFGECAHPINHADYSKIGTVSLGDSEDWKPLAASPSPAGDTPAQKEGAA